MPVDFDLGPSGPESLVRIAAALEASNVYLARIAAAVEAMAKVQLLRPPPRRPDAPPGLRSHR
jgi:hypothetical protein